MNSERDRHLSNQLKLLSKLTKKLITGIPNHLMSTECAKQFATPPRDVSHKALIDITAGLGTLTNASVRKRVREDNCD